MSRVPTCFFTLALFSGLSAYGQAVISTRSGVVHFFEGTVVVAGRPLEAHFGRFATIPEGAELKTEQGARAEILLTPGVFLRVGEKSTIRLASNALADTRVEVLEGSSLLESAELAEGTSVTLTYKGWSLRQTKPGVYRVDCDPPRLQVRGGDVEVTAAKADPVRVSPGMDLAFADVLAPEKSPVEPSDALTDWSDGRAQSISADNAIAADIQDPANMNGNYFPMDAFTYYPMLGLPPLSTVSTYSSLAPYSSGLYGPTVLYQPGFNSIYLPGYTSRPLFLRYPVGGLGRPLYPPSRIGLPSLTLPRGPVVRPVTPPPAVHPLVHVGK
jgi:hypothetical protein